MKSWSAALLLLVICFLLVIFLAPFASDHPDGLEYVADQKGFLQRTEDKEVHTAPPLADYGVRGIDDERTSTIIAGLIGTSICFLAGLALAALTKSRKKEHHETRAA